MALIEFDRVSRAYGTGESRILAIQQVSFSCDPGEFCVILGPSGSGKSTVLNLLGGMDRPDGGQIFSAGIDLTDCTDELLTQYRRTQVGFVFQFYNLLPGLTALENVQLAGDIVPRPRKARDALAQVGLGDRWGHFPAQLSGGEQQRVSIARALCKQPTLMLCDEPTGALDSATGAQILRLLVDLARNDGAAVLVVTHNSLITGLADRVIRLKNGRVESVSYNRNPSRVEDITW